MAQGQLEPASVFEGGLLHDAFLTAVRLSRRASTVALEFSWPWVVPVGEFDKQAFVEQMRSFRVKVILAGVSRFSLTRSHEYAHESGGVRSLSIEGFRIGSERLRVTKTHCAVVAGSATHLTVSLMEPTTRLEIVAASCSVLVNKPELLREWIADPGVRVAPVEFHN